MSSGDTLELSGNIRYFNLFGINYIMQRLYHYPGIAHDAAGSRLERMLIECCFIADKIIQEYGRDECLLDDRHMVSETGREFYLISEALASFAELKNNERLEFFVIEEVYRRIERVHDISLVALLQVRKLYD